MRLKTAVLSLVILTSLSAEDGGVIRIDGNIEFNLSTGAARVNAKITNISSSDVYLDERIIDLYYVLSPVDIHGKRVPKKPQPVPRASPVPVILKIGESIDMSGGIDFIMPEKSIINSELVYQLEYNTESGPFGDYIGTSIQIVNKTKTITNIKIIE